MDDIRNVTKNNDKVFIPSRSGGGTCFEAVLSKAIKENIVKKDDIVIVITDGLDNFDSVKKNYKHMIFKINSRIYSSHRPGMYTTISKRI
jgi:ethanolamine ammonia-lyase small subunit